MTDLLTWDDALLIGVDEIDADHRILVDFVNRLNRMVADGAGAAEFAAEMDRLGAHFRAHLEREERVFARALGADDLRRHEASHREGLRRIERIAAGIRADAGGVSFQEVVVFLHRWLVEHVVAEDFAARAELVRAGVVGDPASRGGIAERFLDRFDIRARIMAVAVAPLAALALLLGAAVHGQYGVVGEMDEVSALVDVAGRLSALGHELQKERGMSSGFLNSSDGAFDGKLRDQRRETDRRLPDALAALAAARGRGLADAAAPVEAALSELEARRAAVSARALAADASFAYYTNASMRLIGAVGAMGKAIGHPEVAKGVVAHLNLMNAKERAGQERGVGAAGFAEAAFAPGRRDRFLALGAEQAAYLDLFRAFAAPEVAAFAEAELGGAASAEVERMRRAVAAGDTRGIAPAAWFDTATARIDRLKAVEDRLAGGLAARASDLRREAGATLAAYAAGGGLVVVLTLGMALALVRGIRAPLESLRESIARLAAGDTAVVVYGQHKSDLIGRIARDIQAFKLGIIRANMAAARDGIDRSVRERRSRQRDRLAREFQDGIETFLGAVAGSAEALQGSAAAMSAAMGDGRLRTASVAAAAAEATANVEAVAAAVEQLSASIREITTRTAGSVRVADAAREDARTAHGTVDGLSAAAQRIGEVVVLIRGIAEKTNLLALNATIEAARAGEAGKGFAVVAAEVKALANQTAKATEDISSQVFGIQSATGDAVAAIDRISGVVVEMGSAAASVAAAVEQQDAATREISGNVAQAARGTLSVSENVEGVARATEEADALARAVAEAARTVSAEAARLRERVRAFLGEMNRD